MKVKISDLQAMVERLISKRFYSKQDAQKIAEVLIYAELTGKGTQGVLKLVSANPLQDIKPEHAPKCIRETPLSAVFDSGSGIGILAAQMATDRLIEIAGRSGFGITAMRNYSSSTGAIGYFARKIAKHDLICIIATNSPSTVAHFGGIEPTYGTNPMAFGFPTADNPIVFDMAASAITYFGLVQAKALGQSIPDDVAIDSAGNPTTDPAAAMKGSILPFDRSYKGSGLAMVVELLAGVASGASYIFDKGDWGSTFMAFSPSLLMDVVEFKRRSSDLVSKIKSKKTTSGKPARIPGYDLEDEVQSRIESGEVELPKEIFEQIKALDQSAAAT
jgi:LDH2 family malate/lactate/ureidoglycolate dehydrogenase